MHTFPYILACLHNHIYAWTSRNYINTLPHLSLYTLLHTHVPLCAFVHIYTHLTATDRLASGPNPCTSPTSSDSSIPGPVHPFSYTYSPAIKLLHTITFVHPQTHHFFSILSQILYHFPQDESVPSIAQNPATVALTHWRSPDLPLLSALILYWYMPWPPVPAKCYSIQRSTHLKEVMYSQESQIYSSLLLLTHRMVLLSWPLKSKGFFVYLQQGLGRRRGKGHLSF